MPWDGWDQHASTLFLSHSFRSRTGSTRSVQESTRRQTHWLELALTCNSAASVSTCTTGLGRPEAQMASQQWWSTLDHHPDSQGRAHPDGHTVRKAEVQDPYTDSSKRLIVRYFLMSHKMWDQNYIEMISILTGQDWATYKTCTTPCTRLRAHWGPCKTIISSRLVAIRAVASRLDAWAWKHTPAWTVPPFLTLHRVSAAVPGVVTNPTSTAQPCLKVQIHKGPKTSGSNAYFYHKSQVDRDDVSIHLSIIKIRGNRHCSNKK